LSCACSKTTNAPADRRARWDLIWECSRRDPPADPRDGAREFPLGCTTHPRRTSETRHHYLAGRCITLHAGVARRPSEAENGGHLCGTALPRSDPRRAPSGSTSGPGRTLSSVVLQHLLQQRSPDRRVGECGIWQVHAGFWVVKRGGSELPCLMPFLSPWRYCNGLCEVSRLPRRKYCRCSILN
jgi:hypothetical protein